MNRKIQSYFWAWYCHSMHITWIPPLVLASIPLQIWYVLHASSASCTSTFRTHSAIIHHQVSPNPAGRTPRCLSIMIKWPDMSVWYADHGGFSFASHSTNSATICRISLLASSKLNSQCFRMIKLVTPEPAPPESLPATSVTVSSVRSTGTSYEGRPGYTSWLLAKGLRALGSFSRSTSRTYAPVLVHASLGCITPPFSHSSIQCNVVRIFPLSTRMWNLFAFLSSN